MPAKLLILSMLFVERARCLDEISELLCSSGYRSLLPVRAQHIPACLERGERSVHLLYWRALTPQLDLLTRSYSAACRANLRGIDLIRLAFSASPAAIPFVSSSFFKASLIDVAFAMVAGI